MKGAPSRERLLARALCEPAAEGASGILTATRGKLKRLFCLDHGALVYATSNLIEEQIGEFLVRRGVIDPGMRAAVVQEAARDGVRFVAALVARPIPGRVALHRGMEELVTELLNATLEWPDGAASFEPGLPKLDGEITVSLSPIAIVLAHAERFPAQLDRVRARIGPPDIRPTVRSPLPKGYDAVPLSPAARYLAATCDGTRDLGEILRETPAGEEATLRALNALLTVGILEPATASRSAILGKRRAEAPLERDECLALFSRLRGANHYTILGVDRDAMGPAIREAYYHLARRYHPDRFRSGPLQELLPNMESFFAQVTEAYNTLHDATARAEYDAQLVAAAQEPSGPKVSETAYLARQNYQRGRALLQQRRAQDALTFLENAVNLDGTVAEYRLELGLLLARNARRRDDAERHLLAAIDLSPTLVPAFLALGQLYHRAGRNGPAIAMLREVIRWEPGHAEAAALLAELGAPAGPSDEPAGKRGFFG